MRSKGSLNKGSGEILKEILLVFNNQTISTRQINERLIKKGHNISWITVRNYLEKLQSEKKVKKQTILPKLFLWSKI